MISKENIKEIIGIMKAKYPNETLRVRDIAFHVLCRYFDDRETVYLCLFGTEGFDDYTRKPFHGDMYALLVERGFLGTSVNDDASITFEENRKGMESLIRDTQNALKEGRIEEKDALKLMGELRVKLNDKFRVGESQQERTIVVNKRYNETCKHCGHEIYIPTLEDLKEIYNLTEKE